MAPDQRLKAHLSLHGVGAIVGDAIGAWEAFKSFGREVAGREGVGPLFQVGAYDFSGEPLFYFDPVAQFETKDDEGEHDHYEQTHCELTAPIAESIRNTKCTLWSFDFPTVEAFYQAVEALPEFKIAVKHSPYKVNAYHERV